MKRPLLIALAGLAGMFSANADSSFTSETVSSTADKVANYFISNYPDVGAKSYVGGKERNSKIWTRGVFYEGLLNMYREIPREEWLKYSVDWGEFHNWVSSEDNEARTYNADYQCCGQAYLQMYLMDPSQKKRMEHIKMRIDEMQSTGKITYWTWIDAVQMSMPVMALLGDITGNQGYWEYMHDMYKYTRDKQGGDKKSGGKPLFNTSTGLWYRDYQFDPPYKDKKETDKDCYWSRGNGWVYMALARVMQFTPESEAYRGDYVADFKLMSEGLLKCQRQDGSWNVSLAAPTNFGQAGSEGPEMTGTSLFVGGMAYGVRAGLLDKDIYLPAITKGWEAMLAAVHPDNGFVGYLQGAGSKPEDGGVITYNSVPDFEDFGYGCWLWGAAEVHALLKQIENGTGGIVNVNSDAGEDVRYYDLMGRPVENPVKGSIYVRGGKCVIF